MDPKNKTVPPKVMMIPPPLDFRPLLKGLEALKLSADQHEKAFANASRNSGGALVRARTVNRTLIESERRLTAAQGLPGRPWYKHRVYAPGVYSGYGAKTLPGIREAIEQGKWQEAVTEIEIAGRVLAAEAALIDSATRIIEQAVKETEK
jgi:N-acetylated-alpha-linked acidic dipeptidase